MEKLKFRFEWSANVLSKPLFQSYYFNIFFGVNIISKKIYNISKCIINTVLTLN